MKRDLSEIQNYLEYLYTSIDSETEKVEMNCDVFEDLREFFNTAIVAMYETNKVQNSLSTLCLLSLLINVIFISIFVFKI